MGERLPHGEPSKQKMKKTTTIMSGGETKGYSTHRIPPEILDGILSRLSVKSLCRLKCVSPSWNSLISSPYFAKTHLKRTSIDKIILVSDSEDLYTVDYADPNPSAKKLDFLSVQHYPQWDKVLGSCNGLLFVFDKGYFPFLLNPTTGERKKLPFAVVLNSIINLVCKNHKPYIFRHGFGYDSSRDDYKVVMFLYPGKTDSVTMNNVAVLVYSLKTDAWRRIQDTHYHPLGLECYSGVQVTERLHWLCRRTGVSDGSKVIVAFNLSDEIFREVQLATFFDDRDSLYLHMAVLGDCLCVIVCPRSYPNGVWMMKELRGKRIVDQVYDKSWMDFLCLLGEDECLMKARGKLLDVLFQEKLVVYNLKKETLRDMVVPGIPPKCQHGITYVESLVSPNH